MGEGDLGWEVVVRFVSQGLVAVERWRARADCGYDYDRMSRAWREAGCFFSGQTQASSSSSVISSVHFTLSPFTYFTHEP
jgi:hypothetical protein